MEKDMTLLIGIAISFLFTAAYYMGPVLVYRFVIYRNRIPRNKARIMCIMSAIILYITLFFIATKTHSEIAPNMKPALLYSAIAYWLIREKNTDIEIKGDLETQIKSYVELYRKLYGTRNEDVDEEVRGAVDEVFIQTIPYLKLIPMKDLQREIYKSKITVEEASLNIVQNFALMLTKENISGEEMIYGTSKEAEAAISVYRYINDLKLEKKYISQFQYDENERLITAIRYNAPFF